jgi:light-regulated signal transduction histidine kinase (bacteriophytochrome)
MNPTDAPEASSSPTFQELMANCAKEDLAHIGAIQTFACILVADPTTRNITACSQNAGDVFQQPTAELLNQKLDTLLGAHIVSSLAVAAMQKSFVLTLPGALALPSGRHHVSLTTQRNTLVIEIEPVITPLLSEAQRQHIIHRPLQTPSPNVLSEVISEFTSRFSELVPFDRIMVYQFLEDWSGQVICEKGTGFPTSMLGLHFPASDIPPQARKLYELSSSRLIADTQTQPVGFVGVTQPPIDLTMSRARACSKVHIRYLENMAVRASFSCSIMFKGQLWGLIACHHATPMHIDLQVRLDCERLARSLSVELMRIHAERKMQMIENFKQGAAALIERLPDLIGGPQDFAPCGKALCDLLEADGLAIIQGEQVYIFGSVPDTPEILVIHDIVASKADNRFFKTECLSSIYPDAVRYSKEVSGLIAMSTASLARADSQDLVFLWFRKEVVATVQWAGRPEKSDNPIQLTDGTHVLSPRTSFAAWAEERRHTCRPWTSEQVFKANLWVHNYARKRNLSRIMPGEDFGDTTPLR